jgi:hypothetical protein
MCQRAEKSRLKTWGPKFLGSPDFPPALIQAISQYDPAGLLLPSNLKAPNSVTAGQNLDPSPQTQEQTSQVLNKILAHKVILNLSGGADKLVPYACSAPFLTFLKSAISPEGWWKDNGLVLDDRIFEGVGHECTEKMQDAAVSFIGDVLAGEVGRRGVRESRI